MFYRKNTASKQRRQGCNINMRIPLTLFSQQLTHIGCGRLASHHAAPELIRSKKEEAVGGNSPREAKSGGS